MLKTPFKQRQFSRRTILLLAMICIVIGDFAIGEGRLMFYFLRRKFHWTLKHCTWFSSGISLLHIIGTFLVVYLVHTVLKVRESLIICIGFIFYVISSVLKALANEDWQIYLAGVFLLGTSGQYALIKSLISKLVEENQIAKILQALATMSTILDPISGLAYNTLYNATIKTNPGLYNFVTAAISASGFFIYIAIIIIEKRSSMPGFEVLENENEEVATEEGSTGSTADDVTPVETSAQ